LSHFIFFLDEACLFDFEDIADVDGKLVFYTARGKDVFIALLEMGLLCTEEQIANSDSQEDHWLSVFLNSCIRSRSSSVIV